MTEQQDKHPSEYSSDLTEERLVDLCNDVREVVEDAVSASGTQYDTGWTKGTLPYGRIHGYLIKSHQEKRKNWLTLTNRTMDYTFKIGNVPFQVVTDDPFFIKKDYRIKENGIEIKLRQGNLQLESTSIIVSWRLFIDINFDNDFPSINLYIIGFDENKNLACVWRHGKNSLTVSAPMKATEKSAEVIIDDAPLKRRIPKRKSVDDLNNDKAK